MGRWNSFKCTFKLLNFNLIRFFISVAIILTHLNQNSKSSTDKLIRLNEQSKQSINITNQL